MNRSPKEQATTVAGAVHVPNGHFIGRDYNHVEVTFSGVALQALLEELLPLLCSPGAQVADGTVRAQGQLLSINAAQAEALGKYLLTVPHADRTERELHYLARLCIDPAYQQWQRRYTPLAGGYRSAPHLDPRLSEILVRGEGPQRQFERVYLPDIRQALDRHASAVLLAQPGAGKTTVLQRLLLDLALQRLQSHSVSGGAPPRLPLFVRLAAQQPTETPLDFLVRMWRAALPGAHTDAAAEFTQALQRGELCLLCDALNEARRERYAERLADWRDFARELPAGNRLLFTCRSQDYYGELAVQQVEIDPLTAEQIADFCRRYLGSETGEQLWQTLQRDHTALLPLAAIPYYLLMIVESYESAGALPTQRATLFAQFALRLLQREGERRHPDWIDPAAQHWALGELAFAMQTLGEGTEVSRAWAADTLPATVTLPRREALPTPAGALLRLGCAATLLSETPSGGFKFAHHLLQEYFAAEALLRRHQAGADLSALWRVPSGVHEMPPAARGEWDPLPGPPTSGWEQTTILAAGLYPALIAAVQPVNPALAARCWLASSPPSNLRTGEGGVGDANLPAPDGVRQGLQQALLARLGNVAIHLRSRIEAGLLLGHLGDPRFALETIKGVQVILPPMVEIPAATATIGSGWWDRQARQDEKLRHTVTLAAYALGRYPVTNAEYACFMAAGGYEDERYWTAGGQYWLRGEPVPEEEDPVDVLMSTWRQYKNQPEQIDIEIKQGHRTERDRSLWIQRLAWTEQDALRIFRSLYPLQRFHQPRFWKDETFSNPNQPVVGICWYEAIAYTNWLTEVTENRYRLPTEAEWEWASHRNVRRYPWGWRWNENKLNSIENAVLFTTPVGCYPQGATRELIYDLVGNVWEFTSTLWKPYPYNLLDGRENLDVHGMRVQRGGGWAASRKNTRCASRYAGRPNSAVHSLGYRLARTIVC